MNTLRGPRPQSSFTDLTDRPSVPPAVEKPRPLVETRPVERRAVTTRRPVVDSLSAPDAD